MAPKLRRDPNDAGALWHTCPGCEMEHKLIVSPALSYERPVWKFNGNFEAPTFDPSFRHLFGHEDRRKVCHYTITNGNIQFHGDCTHHLKDTTVPMRDIE